MRLLVIASALDLSLPFSCTPAWWQLLQALAQEEVDLIVTTYAGRSFESPWWASYENPCLTEGKAFSWSRSLLRARSKSPVAPSDTASESMAERSTRTLAHAWVAPRWKRHIAKILERERNVSAVIVLTAPPNHLAGVPAEITRQYGVPFYFYDGDVPASLPRFRGFESGFRIYQGADMSEYEAVLSNSRCGGSELIALGASRVYTLYFGADPDLFAPAERSPELDVFFYGHGGEYREGWIDAMLRQPSEAMPDSRFAVRGSRYGVELDAVENLPYLTFSQLRRYVCSSKINLLITRSTHADVPGSSTCRPFELAGFGACMVSNPYQGIEEWFEPEREIIVVHSAEEAIDRYRWLLANESNRLAIGRAARERLVRDHTYRHRARRMIDIITEQVPADAQSSGLAQATT